MELLFMGFFMMLIVKESNISQTCHWFVRQLSKIIPHSDQSTDVLRLFLK